MKTEQLRAVQMPLKALYKECPDAAFITLKTKGNLGEGVTCKVQTGKALIEAGLHPATGGNGLSACSGDMMNVSRHFITDSPIGVKCSCPTTSSRGRCL